LSSVDAHEEKATDGIDNSNQHSEINKEGDLKRETAFDQLVLPPGHKQMVLSLIAQHFRDKESRINEHEADIVRGKGSLTLF
jgi:hypothetical protein